MPHLGIRCHARRSQNVQTVRALCALAVLVALSYAPLRAQVSPGPLSQAHSALEGAANCLDCHGRGDDSLDDKCATCHREIAFQRSHELGLHGTETDGDCAGCHPEHAGVEFDLIDWGESGRAGFNHTRTGWTLEGKHAAATCRACHTAEFQTGRVSTLIKRKDRARSWLGLKRDCLACHEDYHESDLGTDCASCHQPTGWKRTPGFDHSASSFPLSGKHVDVECNACHLVPGRVFRDSEKFGVTPRFKPVAHDECSACHVDPHQGRLGTTCRTCHVTDSFRQVTTEDFNHDRTRFSLVGKHGSIACESCHDPKKAWGKKPRFDSCGECHSDPHAGRATLEGRTVDCNACHDERGFAPSTFTAEQHQRSDYPLEGKHAAVACRSCHSSTESAGVLQRPSHASCSNCHSEAHADQLVDRKGGNACESCHSVDGWKPSTFDRDRHTTLDLPLEGRHARIDCSACHGETRPGLPPHPRPAELGRARVALSLLDAACASCHADPHASRFSRCPACHDSRQFQPSTVDTLLHASFGYPLEGAHRATPCSECHKELTGQRAPSTLLLAASSRQLSFRTAHERCIDCHDSTHGEQFAGRIDGGACDGCHSSEAFRPAPRFDHDRDAAFVLTGAHEAVPCEDCHRKADGDVGNVVVYRPVPHRCADCHTGKVKGGNS